MNPESEMASASEYDALRMREKKLSCLYAVASELESIDGLTDELLGKIVEHIPPSFQFPEVAVARIVLADNEYHTANFRETAWSLSSFIKDDGNQTGTLEVCYLEERPESDEGPFLKQERKLLDCLAGLLAQNLKRLKSQEALRVSESHFHSSYDQSPIGIGFMDKNGIIVDCNDALARIIGTPRELMIGYDMVTGVKDEAMKAAVSAAMSGEVGLFEGDYETVTSNRKLVLKSTYSPLLESDGTLKGVLFLCEDITECKHAEEELRQAKDFAVNLIETANAIVVGLDTKGNITIFSNTAEEITGYTLEELQDRNWFEVVVPRERYPQVWAEFERLTAGGLPKDFENPILTKTGEERYIVWRNKEIYENGKITGTISFGIDITERKRAEEALELSETNLRRAQWIGNLGSWSWDVPTNELNWSDQVFRIYGLDPKHTEPSYDIVIKTLAPECREDFTEAIQDALEKDEPFEGDYCIILPDGSRRNTHTAGKVIRDEQRNPLKMFGIVQDITERKRMERELHDASSYTRSLIETSLDPLVTISSDGKIMDVNKATEVVTGVPRDELIGSDFSNYFTEPEQAREGYQQVFKTGSIMDYPLAIKHVSGRKTDVLYNAAVYRDDTGKIAGVFAAARDITKRKQAEEEKEKLREQLMQSQKMESVGRLAGGIAHDFNNALQTILGNTTLMMMEVPEGSKDSSLRDNLEAVQRAGEHSADLTRQLLAFARQQAVKPRLLDLNDTVADILSMLKRLIGEDINVSWLPEAEAATVKVDPAQVYQVLANLCINAREAIEGVGNVTIETHNICFDAAYVKDHAGFETGDYVMLEVSDDGCGMGKEVRNHLFEPFYTTRAFGKGTGLGLATVYGIVKQNDGFINVYSEPGEGTTFKIYLPLAAGKPSGREEAPVQLPRGHGETVLLVEDDIDILKLGTEILERLGYRVIAAAIPDEAIDKAQKQIGEIALLVTDVVMPQMNGHDLATRLQELKPELKCLYMSGYTADIITHHGVLDEGLNFIQKPFSVEDVAAKVRYLIDSE